MVEKIVKAKKNCTKLLVTYVICHVMINEIVFFSRKLYKFFADIVFM